MSNGNSKRVQTVLIAGTLAASIALLIFVSLNPLPNQNSRSDSRGVNCTEYNTSFVIIADEKGYNDSIDHSVPRNYWPILCAHLGETVRITVENMGSEPHGFAVGHYYEAGTSVPQGNNVTITINADRTGSFLIYCTILCAVHPWMLSGLLVVNP